jgi:phage tail-like protein
MVTTTAPATVPPAQPPDAPPAVPAGRGDGASPSEAVPAIDRIAPSRLLQYLPAIYAGDPFIGRFLRIFEDLHMPLRQTAAALSRYFDPALAPDPMRGLLADWVGAEHGALAGRMAPEAWGRLIRESVELHRWRGTKRGLRRALELATGRAPLITDYGDGLVLSDDARLGTNTRLENGSPFEITVTFECEPDEIDAVLVDAIIRRHRPAHVTHAVAFAPDRDGA